MYDRKMLEHGAVDLTALREQHRLHIDHKQLCRKTLSKGDSMLLSDPLQMRNQWKLAKVIKAVKSSDVVREAETRCCKRVLRRPVNQLFPLEIGADRENRVTSRPPRSSSRANRHKQQKRYNLRLRQRKHDMADHPAESNIMSRKYRHKGLQYIRNPLLETVIECRKDGVILNVSSLEAYELCVNAHCISERSPPLQKMVRWPPEELLLESEAACKLRFEENHVTIMEICPAQQFCSTVDCTLSSANILNPSYTCYTTCYVPVTVGRPVRLILEGVCGLFYFVNYAIAKTVCE
ncbi:hypothetical protein GCK32_014533 [Trichostrongylus colubriformis]|uniref:DUF5641 domain-containing protein n=1 Tax=Trichostrongylus colubriformis TaxID=6319 RepID=A0AAN8J2A3_TRICO